MAIEKNTNTPETAEDISVMENLDAEQNAIEASAAEAEENEEVEAEPVEKPVSSKKNKPRKKANKTANAGQKRDATFKEHREAPVKKSTQNPFVIPEAIVIGAENELIEVDDPTIAQRADIDAVQRSIAQHSVLFCTVYGNKQVNNTVIIYAKYKTLTVVFRADDFFANSVMNGLDSMSEAEKAQRYRRKASHRLGSVVSFVPKDIGTNDSGTPIVIASRKDAMDAQTNRYFFGKNAPADIGVETNASILSVGPDYMVVEALGIEATVGSGRLSAFEYIEDVSKKYHVGEGIRLAIETLSVDEAKHTVNVNFSHAMVERRSSVTTELNEDLIGCIYSGTVVAVSKDSYRIVLDGLKITGIVKRQNNISDEMLQKGDKVAMQIRHIHPDRHFVTGGCHKSDR